MTSIDRILNFLGQDFKILVNEDELNMCKNNIKLILDDYKKNRDFNVTYTKLFRLIDHWCGNTDSFFDATEYTKLFLDSLVDNEEQPVRVLLSKSYAGFFINKDFINEYNLKKNSSLSSFDDECRYIPEFIEKVTASDANLYVATIPHDVFKFNAFSIDEYDGLESIQIHYSILKLKKIEQFFDVLNKIIYDDSFNLSIEKKFRLIRLLAPQDLLENKDFDALSKNAKFFPL